MKFSLRLSICSVFIVVGFSGCSNDKNDKAVLQLDEGLNSTPKVDTLVKHTDTLSIVAVGDIMLGSSYPSEKHLPPDDAKNSFVAVDSLLTGDVVFGNLEGVLLNDGKTTKIDTLKLKTKYAFRMPERYGGILKRAGFNVLSIANNHIGDFGMKGRMTTAKILDSLKINYAGQLQKPFAVFTINKVKYGFCAFAPNANTVSINDVTAAKAIVSRLKDSVDVVIVSFHGGGEGNSFQRVTRKKEVFYKENRGNVYEFAHAVIDAGADVVLGHGPHVTRAVEIYRSKFIAYSLGNFCTRGTFSLARENGFAPLLRLKIDRKGNFLSAEVISVKQDKINGLTLDGKERAFKKMKELTDADFPGHSLKFEGNTIKLVDLAF
ncbi:hypothetical protein ABIB40_000924 [Pedobacter sp. UYP30]|uniref:CapA family protein n=1 Tax=Pedobacter sp. UYP30 TaxID=1756400 RepID=UPI0033986731